MLKLYAHAAGDSAQTLVCKQVDLNNDGKIDIVYHYDDGGALTFEEFDLDFDGRFDLRAFYQGGRKVREEMDTNYDQRVDFTKYYEADRLVRIERDANNDGRVDEWQYYEAGKLDRIGYDTTGSGRVDKWERAPDDVGAEPAAAAPRPAPQPAAGTAPPSPTATTPGGTSGPGGPGSSVGAPTAPPTAPPATAALTIRAGRSAWSYIAADVVVAVAATVGDRTGDDLDGMSSAKEADRRGAPRMALDAAAIIRFESVGGDMRSRIINASRNGVLLAMPAARPVGTRMHVTVRIGEPPVEIKLHGIVVHVAENPDAAPGFTTQVGVFLTDAGPEWETLCRRLADAAPG